MPDQEQYNLKLNEANLNLKEITKFNVEKDLVRTKELGDKLNFSASKECFSGIISLSKELRDGSINQLPYNKLETVVSQTKDILNKLNIIKIFDPATQSPNRDDLVRQVRESYENYYNNLFVILTFIRIKKIKPKEIEEDVKNKLVLLDKTSIEASKKLEEINEILDKTKQAAVKTGVAKYAKSFEDESNEHDIKSRHWLYAVMGASLLTIAWGVVLLFWIKVGLSTGEAIQYSIAKFIVLSALFYALVWVTKNYNAHRHNYIVNKHRANSLNSFETFVKSTDDSATKDAVLLQATQSIFSPQPSGYDSKDSDGDMPNKFIEILRHIEPKSK